MSSIKLYLTIAALVAAFLFGAMANGWRWEGKYSALQMDYAQKQRESAMQAMQLNKQRRAVAAMAEKVLNAEAAAQEAAARTIIKEVVKYETVYPDQCILPAGWCMLHNAAATGRMPDDTGAACQTAGRSAGIEDGIALRVVTENYDACRQAIIDLKGWQQWYGSIKNAN